MNLNDMKCAPHKKYIDGSCFSLDSLKIIAEEYNKTTNKKININTDKKILVNSLTNAFSKSCSTQTCWLTTNILKYLKNKEIHENTFRPLGPSTGYQWLSTTDINKVINQYENKYNDFIFLGALPNDFQEVDSLGLSNIDFNDFVDSGKTKLGMVINLDNHNQSGSHWVALYTDLKKNQLYYFDSLGQKPKSTIKNFNNKILNYLLNKKYNKNLKIENIIKDIKYKNKNKTKNILNKFDIRYNHIQHQFDNSECGVYSINFILRLAKGETFDHITKNITNDDEMNKCRKVYFR
jgi:hypothetical protein